MGESDGPDKAREQITTFAARRAERLARRDAVRADIDAGSGPPAAIEALHVAEDAVTAPLSEDEREYFQLEVADAVANRDTFDPKALGEKLARDVKRIRKARSGGLFGALHPHLAEQQLIRREIRRLEPRRLTLQPSPLIENSHKQTEILGRLLDLTENQSATTEKWAKVAGVAAVVSVVLTLAALVIAIIAL